MKPTLTTRRLVLRPVRDDDLPHLLALDADPEVRRHVDLAAPPTLDEVRDSVVRWRTYDAATPDVGFWVAEHEGRFAGWFHLRPPRPGTPAEPGDQELGYRLRRDLWGRGLATEGGARLMEHAFTSVGAKRVTASALVANGTSWRVMEKLGMARVGEWAYRAKDGSDEPAVLFAIARERWFADRFLDRACLGYTDADHPSRRAEARAALDTCPAIVEDLAVACALGLADRVAARLAADPGAALRSTGPRAWAPLLYLAYSRVTTPESAYVATARALLDAGADPDAHFWWGDQYRFTALTGVLGEGEQGPVRQPPHPDHAALLALLLDAGARADEGQGLYDRMFSGRWDHLPPLFAHGLRPDTPANWRERPNGPPTSEPVLTMLLCWDADHGHTERARLLLEAGVSPVLGREGGPSPWRLAFLGGHRGVRGLLQCFGAPPEPVSEGEMLAEAILAADDERARALRAALPAALAAQPSLLTKAATEHPGTAALALALDLGVSPDRRDASGVPALHSAAWAGRVDSLGVLLAAGADVSAKDARFGATAEGWAEHAGQDAARTLLTTQARG